MTDSVHCTGCSACAAICSRNAIRMEQDAEGFSYPVIDQSLCVHCGQCSRVCPVTKDTAPLQEQPRTWLVKADEENLCLKSSSGGLFSLLAMKTISRGGLVFGSAMREDCYGAEHIGIDTAEGLDALRGSKYVQSDLNQSFREAKAALEGGKPVLFTGTPCQIAGLKSYLGGKHTENLLAVDVICHGVPSPMVWRDYLRTIEKSRGGKAVQVFFRDKTEGWQRYSLKCIFSDGSVYRKNVMEDLYLRGFVENLFLRPACHGCVFKDSGYAGDLTIGDFWGAAEQDSGLSGSIGVSLAVAHTEKGRKALEALTDCRMEPVPWEQALKHNRAYFNPAPASPFQNRALQEIRRRGTEKVLSRYCGFGLEPRIRKKLAALMKKKPDLR